ncbi:hypothetical protein CYMTET_15067, partial [Cymbomonas tetramitiformis]
MLSASYADVMRYITKIEAKQKKSWWRYSGGSLTNLVIVSCAIFGVFALLDLQADSDQVLWSDGPRGSLWNATTRVVSTVSTVTAKVANASGLTDDVAFVNKVFHKNINTSSPSPSATKSERRPDNNMTMKSHVFVDEGVHENTKTSSPSASTSTAKSERPSDDNTLVDEGVHENTKTSSPSASTSTTKSQRPPD